MAKKKHNPFPYGNVAPSNVRKNPNYTPTINDLFDAAQDFGGRVLERAKKEESLPDLTPVDPFQDFLNKVQGINVPATPYDQLFSQAKASAGAQFDPLIQQLQAEMEKTKRRGKQSQTEARQMYDALAQDIAAQLPDITNQMAQASKQAEDRYNQTQAAMQQQYDTQAQQQAELYKKLGIQAAAPEASQQAMEDQAYFQQQSESDEDAALQLLEEMKNADVSYNRQSADNTRLAGANVASDIGAQLEDYLQIAGGKMAGLKSGRESAIQAMLMELQNQDAQRVNQAEQQEYSRMMDMVNLQLRMQEIANKGLSAAGSPMQLFKGTNGPAGATNYLSEIYGENNMTSMDIMEAINDVMNSPTVIAGRYESPDLQDTYGKPQMLDVNDAYMRDLLRKRLLEGDLDPKTPTMGTNPQYSDADINHAINALMAMMGKLR